MPATYRNRNFGRQHAQYVDQETNQTDRHTVQIDRMLAHVPISAREQAIADAQLRYVLHTFGRDKLRDLYFECANNLYVSDKKFRPQYRHGLRRKYYEPRTLRKDDAEDSRASVATLLSDVGTFEEDRVADHYSNDKTGLFPDPRHAIYLAGKELREAQHAKLEMTKTHKGSFEHAEAGLRQRAAEKEFKRLMTLDQAVERHLSDQVGRHLMQDWARRHARWILTGNARLKGERYHHVDKIDHAWSMQQNLDKPRLRSQNRGLPELLIHNNRVYISTHSRSCFCDDCVNFNKVHQRFGLEYTQDAHRKYQLSKRHRSSTEDRTHQDTAGQPVPIKIVDGQVVNYGGHGIRTDPYAHHRPLHQGEAHGAGDSRIEYACSNPGCHAASEGYLGMLMFNFIRRGELERYWPRRRVQKHGRVNMHRPADSAHEEAMNRYLLEDLAWKHRKQPQQQSNVKSKKPARMTQAVAASGPVDVPPQPRRDRERPGRTATGYKPAQRQKADARAPTATQTRGAVRDQEIPSSPSPVLSAGRTSDASIASSDTIRNGNIEASNTVLEKSRDGRAVARNMAVDQSPAGNARQYPSVAEVLQNQRAAAADAAIYRPKVDSVDITPAAARVASAGASAVPSAAVEALTQPQLSRPQVSSPAQKPANPLPSETVTVIRPTQGSRPVQESRPPAEKAVEKAAENVVVTRVVSS